jgi:hypothetical protein
MFLCSSILDIHHILSQSVDEGFGDLRRICDSVQQSVEDTLALVDITGIGLPPATKKAGEVL